MSKKDNDNSNDKAKLLKQEFDNFFINALTKYRKVDKNKERKNLFPTTEQCRKQLEEVAKEMKLPIEDRKVVVEWCKRGGYFNDKIFVELIAPLYYPAPKFRIEWNEELGHYTIIKNL